MQKIRKYYPRATLNLPDSKLKTDHFALTGITNQKTMDHVLYSTSRNEGEFYIQNLAERQSIVATGRLLNTREHDWELEFVSTYKNFWRASKCVLGDHRVEFTVEDKLISGFMTELVINRSNLAHSDFRFIFIPEQIITVAGAELKEPVADRMMGTKGKYLKASLSAIDSNFKTLEEEICLKNINKTYREKAQIDYEKVVTHGAEPVKTSVTISVHETMKRIKNEEGKKQWVDPQDFILDVANVLKSKEVSLTFDNQQLTGYIVRGDHQKKAGTNFKNINFGMVLTGDYYFNLLQLQSQKGGG